MHEVLVTNEGEAVRGAPHFLRSMPQSKKDYDGKTYSLFSSSCFSATLHRIFHATFLRQFAGRQV